MMPAGNIPAKRLGIQARRSVGKWRHCFRDAAGEAEVEAQARTEGRHEDDVRKGGAGGSEARQQGGEGFPGQEPEGLHLSYLALPLLRLRPPGDAVLLVVMPRRMLRPGPRSGGAAREYGCQEHPCTL